MPRRDIIVVGASAGGIEAVSKLLHEIPASFPAAIFVVIHLSPDVESMIPSILGRATRLEIVRARNGEPIREGRVYVAPPDEHLLLEPGRMATTKGPKENGFRPAVDPLFRTAARVYGERVAGVVLSGALDDGAYGLLLIKREGGVAIAQHPDEAAVPSMPQHAIKAVEGTHVLPIEKIASLLVELASGIGKPTPVAAAENRGEEDVAVRGDHGLETGSLPGPSSGFTCPDCGGALWEVESGRLLRYRCHLGHAYNEGAFLHLGDERLEGAMWSALRALEEHAAIRRRLSERAIVRNWSALAETYQTSAEEYEKRADVIREVLTGMPTETAAAEQEE
jgi:two-component system chemotaxis response regulator CheB